MKISDMPTCPYCNSHPELISGEELYPGVGNVKRKMFYVCRGCDARVGCHRNTVEPLGSMANAELRQARMRVHRLLDPLWLSKPTTERRQERFRLYAWLARKMDLPLERCHVAMFELDQCDRAAQLLKERGANEHRPTKINPRPAAVGEGDRHV